MEVTLRDSALVMRATPTGREREAWPLTATLSAVTGFDVRVLEYATTLAAATWRADWPIAQDRPRAIELTWLGADDATAPPLRVVLAPLERPRS